MDPQVGDFASGDVLIEGSRIVAVEARIEADATVVDASGMIVLPGFCDPHIHCWQGALGRIIPNNTSSYDEESGKPVEAPHPTRSYQNVLHRVFAPACRPQDMYIGTLLTLMGAISGGITTVCDNSHNSRTPQHSDACVAALIDSGVRGIHAYGRPRAGNWDGQFPADVARLKQEYFSSDDQLVGMRLYMLGRDPLEELASVVRMRQELGLWLSFESGFGGKDMGRLYDDGWFDGRETINHGHFISAEDRAIIAAHGSKVNVCPRIEAQFRFGNVPYQEWLDAGLKPAISNDDPATYAINTFSEMQCLYAFHRSRVLSARIGTDQGPPKLATLRGMLEAATIRGAENCGLDHKVGSLTPGKQADIILIDVDKPHLTPMNNALCTAVQGASVGDVSIVMIAGRLVKWQGRLLGTDFNRIKVAAENSRDYLFGAVNWPLQPIDVTD
ncbi:amidohydrolase family protein [Mesorhizobium sp. CAU 1732]|uniref:amidohydrolase family protein n=1 Tax=Mesorhizobium sp. CAU 1732 TaxID=3140358 RepID=UPI003260DED2